MSMSRDLAIKEIIKNCEFSCEFEMELTVNSVFAVDQDGEVFLYESIDDVSRGSKSGIWGSNSKTANYVGKVKPFRVNGWKKSLWNIDGNKI